MEDTAAGWVARLRRPEVTESDEQAFAEWLAEYDRHGKSFDEYAALWALAGSLDQSEREPLPRPAFWQWMAVAASAVLALGLFLLVAPQDAHYSTLAGEQREIRLDDGSELFLNTRSAIDVVRFDERREVRLESGEVFFRIARDEAHPFVVRAGDTEIVVLGTRFNVRQLPAVTSVEVEEGIVAVTAPGTTSPHLLHAGEALRIEGDTRTAYTLGTDTIAGWRGGQLVYTKLPLREVIDDLNRYLPVTVSLADDSIGDVTVTAVLQVDGEEAMLDAIASGLNLRWNRIGDRLILLSRGS
ncbi:MAG: FecR domain-containing protein [Pseudomonadales bacterium]